LLQTGEIQRRVVVGKVTELSKLQFQVLDAETASPASVSDSNENKDYFIVRDGVRYAGTHLILDVYGAERLDELEHVETALRKAVDAAGATLLHIHLHHFTPNGGISGVAVLAESHISIHTWPECGYAALDVFMCGETNPHATIEILREAFSPERIAVEEHLRGRGA
jgi:S-adenosylmethionine decarboxylase